jgi:RNA polymerase sigma factor (sigma-70 family)
MTEPTPSPEIDELLAYRGWVRRLCRQLVRNEAEAEDVEQETWRRALESPPRHRSNLKGWLATVVRSAAIQRGRHASVSRAGEESLRQNLRAGADVEGAEADRGSGPDATAEQRETFALLHRLLTELEEPYGEVVFLRYVQGLPPRRIAKRLGLPVATVKTRLNRGLEILRRRTRKQLGSTWRNRCMVFVPSLPSVVATSLTTTIAMSKPTKLILAAAFLILAIPVYSVLENDRGADEVEESTEAVVSAAAPVVDAVAEVVAAELPSESDAPRVEQTLPKPSGPPLKIVVKDRLTRKPVAGVEVFVLDPGHPQIDVERFNEQRSKLWRSESLTRGFGTRFETDEFGEVEVPGVYDGWQIQICASTGASYDSQVLSDLEGHETVHVELLLRKRVNRTVEVVDATGAPVPELQVAWLLAGPNGWSDAGAIMLTSTDALGRAHFRNMQVRGSDFEGQSMLHAMSARFGSVHPVRQEFDLFEVDPAPIRLQLPPGFALKVQVDEELRRSCVDGSQIALCAVAEGETRQNFFDTGARWNAKAWATFLDGEAIFPIVEPAFQGYFLLQTEESTDLILQRVEIASDAEGAQIVTVHLPSNDNLIEFVIVDQEGEVLDAIPWSIVVNELGDAPIAARSVHTRPGIARTRKLSETQGYVRASPHDRDYFLRVQSRADPSDVQFTRLEFDAALLTPRERIVRVEIKDNLIVSGRVVDQAGKPVAGARVRVYGGSFRHPGTGVNLPQYISATADELGEFRIRGDRLSTSRLTVIAPDRAQSEFQFVQGAAGQEFQVTIFPQLKGSILTDSGVPPSGLHARLDPLQEVKQVGTVRIYTATGVLESRSVSPGQFQLVVEDSFLQEVFRSEAIDLQEGVVQPDFLNPLDLRGKLHVHQLQVFGPSGEHATRFALHEVDQNWIKENRRSPLTLVTAVDRLRVVVDAEGCAMSEPTTLMGERTIQLSKGVSVQIELPDKLVLANDRYDWALRFEAVNPNPFGWKPVREIFLDQDRQVIDLPSSGAWQVHLKLQRSSWRAAMAGHPDEFSNLGPIDAFGGGGFEFSVPVGRDEWVLQLPLRQEVLDKLVSGG